MRIGLGLSAAVLCIPLSASAAANASSPPPQQKIIARIDLSKPFHLPPGASFTATQGRPVAHPYFDDETAPGLIHLCVRVAASAPCFPDLDDSLKYEGVADMFSEVHFLQKSEIVYPGGAGAPALLHLQVSSLWASDGDQARAGLILAYRPAEHRFEVIFREQMGLNNNQEARYVTSGPLKSAMITVHPTGNAPFGYWVAVHRLTSDYSYKQVLRYRSATLYGDGNPLAVIDSEMPNIMRRLGFWHSGQPLPLPHPHCPRPRLIKTELWCS